MIILLTSLWALGAFIAWFILPKRLKKSRKLILCLMSWILISYQAYKEDRKIVERHLAKGICPDCKLRYSKIKGCSDFACRIKI